MYPLVRPRKREKPTTRRKFVNLLPFSALGSSRIPFLPGVCVFSFCFEGGVLAPIDRLTSSFSFSVRERRVFDRVLLNELRLGQVHQLLLPALSLLTVSLFTLFSRESPTFSVCATARIGIIDGEGPGLLA